MYRAEVSGGRRCGGIYSGADSETSTGIGAVGTRSVVSEIEIPLTSTPPSRE